MTNLKVPVYDKPERPVWKYYKGTSKDVVISTKRMFGRTINVAVMDNIDYSIKTDKYKRKMARYEAQTDVWADNNVNGYALVLQHCPDELETERRNQEAWAVIKDARNVVDLLILIRDLQYNKFDWKRSIMATVEADFDHYSCAQLALQLTDGYYKVFTSTVDTINANGGQECLHLMV